MGLAASILTIIVGAIAGIKYAKTYDRATEELETLEVKGSLGAILRPSFHEDGQIMRGLYSFHLKTSSAVRQCGRRDLNNQIAVSMLDNLDQLLQVKLLKSADGSTRTRRQAWA